jgi:rRNA maturation endonuclease Nob1
MKAKISIEKLFHFSCPSCKKWFSIGDFPKSKKHVYCPWCGKKLQVEIEDKK